MSETMQCSNDGMNWVPVNTLALQYFKFYRIVSDGVISAMGQTNTFNLELELGQANRDIDKLVKLKVASMMSSIKAEDQLEKALALLKEWYDDNFDGQDMYTRTGEFLKEIRAALNDGESK